MPDVQNPSGGNGSVLRDSAWRSLCCVIGGNYAEAVTDVCASSSRAQLQRALSGKVAGKIRVKNNKAGSWRNRPEVCLGGASEEPFRGAGACMSPGGLRPEL